jgi:protein TonB
MTGRRRAVAASALFHVIVTVTLLLAGSVAWEREVQLSSYQVELVDLPRTAASRPQAAVLPPRPIKPPEKTAATFKPEQERKPEKVFEKPPPAARRQPRIPDIRSLPEPKQSARVAAKAEGPQPPEPDAAPPALPRPVEPAEPPPKTAPPVAAVPSIEAGVELRDFKFPYYLKLIQGKISNGWAPPAVDQAEAEREVVITFELANDGRVSNVAVSKSSGNAFFDQAALRAVYAADPLPKFPDGLRESSLKFHFSFVLTRKG